MTQYKTQYGTVFAVKEHNGAPAIICKGELSETWALSSMIDPDTTPGAWTAEELQAQLDSKAAIKGWQPLEEPASAEPPEIVDEARGPEDGCPYLQPLENSKKYNCQCSICGDKFANREICNKSYLSCGWYLDRQDKEAQTEDGEKDTPVTDSCQCRTCKNESCFAHGCTKECPANAGESCLTTSCPEYQGKKDGTPCTDCRCPECDDDACPQSHCDKSDAGLGCMAPDDDCPPQNPTDAAPASRADVGAAEQSLSAAFDYSGLNVVTVDTLHLAENIIRSARQKYIVDLAGAVDMAHEELVRNSDGHNQHSDETFVAWCRSVGISKTTAYQLLQVQALISGATPEEQATLEAASPSLLYAAAKPSAPAELVQAVKDGDITSHKQYKDLLARYDAEKAARAKAEKAAKAMTECYNVAHKNEEFTLKNLKSAQAERDEAIKERDGARDALAAAKLRGDKLKAENDALKAQPVEAQVVDEEEINRRAQARADELTAPLREELEALRARHPADLEEAEQAIRDAYDSALYTGRAIENAWHSLRPLLACMDSERRVMAVRQVEKILTRTQEELRKCL